MTIGVKDKRGRFIVGNTKADGSGADYIYSAARAATQKTADGQVKASAGVLFAFVIAFVGVNVGDKVEIRDALAAGAGTVIFTIVASAANETHTLSVDKGIQFDTGIYHDETKGAGTINGSYVYV